VTTEKEEILGKILQEQRKAKKISQEKLAKLTGLDRTAISLIERGKRSPIFITILKICSALEIKPSELLSIYEEKDPDYHMKKGGKHGK
jgi:transcriptional regulator with XRE-family HTH domain